MEARAASLVSPNTGPIVASTTTDANGMWEFTALADSAHDIKITYSGNVWWHKGLTKHNVDAIFYTTPTPSTDNFFKTAGFEMPASGPWTVTAGGTSGILGSWSGINGAGSSATITRETTTKSADSGVSAKIVQTKVAGSLQLYEALATPEAARGKQMVVSFQVHQSVASAVRAFIGDSAGITYSSTSATTGSFITMTVTRTIDASATVVTAGISVDLSATVYVDNGVWAMGAVAPTYRPEVFTARSFGNDLLADQSVDSRVLGDNSVITSKIVDGHVTAAKHAANSVQTAHIVDANVTDVKMATQKVTRAGDTMTGALVVQTAGNPIIRAHQPVNALGVDAAVQLSTGSGWAVHIGTKQSQWYHAFMDGAFNLLWGFDGTDLKIGSNKVWHAGNDGAGSGLDADTVDTLSSAALLARANHTGTQAASTLSDLATAILARSQHTGTQAPSTISPQGSGSGLDADTVDGSHASAFALSGHSHGASGIQAIVGTYSGNGAGSRVISGLGITPVFVVIQQITTTAGMTFMSGHDAVTIINGGFPGTFSGAALASGSFTVPGTTGMNTSGQTYRYVAFGS